MNKFFDMLNTPRVLLVALALIISVNGFLFITYSRSSDQEPIVRQVEVLRSAQAPDPPEEKEPNREPRRSVESSAQKEPDAASNDTKSDNAKSDPQPPKRSEDAASEDRSETKAGARDEDTRDGDAHNEPPPLPPVAQEASAPPQPTLAAPSEASLEGAPPTEAPVSPAVAPQEAPPPAPAPASAPATAPASATETPTSPASSEAGQPSPEAGGTDSPQTPAVAPPLQDFNPRPEFGTY